MARTRGRSSGKVPPPGRHQWVWVSSASGVSAIMFTVKPASLNVSMLPVFVPVSMPRGGAAPAGR